MDLRNNPGGLLSQAIKISDFFLENAHKRYLNAILDKVSKEILKTAIAQGVIEWSGQTLIGITKFHGPNWLVSGTFQAVSAAYLTRVVSSSLADFMAITKGVEEPDLDFIKKNSEKIVEEAFEKEKINWKEFIFDLRKPLMKLSFGS